MIADGNVATLFTGGALIQLYNFDTVTAHRVATRSSCRKRIGGQLNDYERATASSYPLTFKHELIRQRTSDLLLVYAAVLILGKHKVEGAKLDLVPGCVGDLGR